MAKHSESMKDAIIASSATYNRCTQLLRKELKLKPTELGLGPRATFEETVTLLRAKIEREHYADSIKQQQLTHDDFSFNEVLRLMRLCTIKMSMPLRIIVTREEFIRRINKTLQEEGGLVVVRHLVARARTGRYAWIESHIQTFLHRNSDVVWRSKKSARELVISSRKLRW